MNGTRKQTSNFSRFARAVEQDAKALEEYVDLVVDRASEVGRLMQEMSSSDWGQAGRPPTSEPTLNSNSEIIELAPAPDHRSDRDSGSTGFKPPAAAGDENEAGRRSFHQRLLVPDTGELAQDQTKAVSKSEL
jgi:hypothetical protein